MQSQARDLFQLQAELIDRKIVMVTNQAIDRVIDQIISLKLEMNAHIHQLRQDMAQFKQDMNIQMSEFKQEIGTQMSEFKQEIGTQMSVFKQDMITEMSEFKQDVANQINELKQEMVARFSALENRVVVVETRLGIVNAKQGEIRSHLVDYTFKAGWMLLGATIATCLAHYHFIL